MRPIDVAVAKPQQLARPRQRNAVAAAERVRRRRRAAASSTPAASRPADASAAASSPRRFPPRDAHGRARRQPAGRQRGRSSSPARRNARSCGCMRTAADVPRSTSRPQRSGPRGGLGGDQDQRAIERDAAERHVPFPTSPSFTTGCICGVVAHAHVGRVRPERCGGGRPCTSNWMSY